LGAAFESFESLSDFQKDALKEVGNIGAGNAATALSKLVGERIEMSVPQVRILPFSEVPEIVGGPEVVVSGVYIRITGSAPGGILFLLPFSDSKRLLAVLLKKQISDQGWGELENSTLMEVGNILCGAFLNALAMFTSLSFFPSVPSLCIDMAGAILGTALHGLGEIGDEALFIETEFSCQSQHIMGYFFFLPEAESLATILSSLGVNR
jgi:chemotaxis protein CheC